MISDVRLAELSAAAYLGTPTLESEFAHFYLTEEPDGSLVGAFRGTRPEHLPDWLYDIEAWPSSVDPRIGAVHAGFLHDVLSLQPQLLDRLKNRRVVLTGHSKGGGEAKIAAGICIASGIQVVQLTTFGAPRVAAPGNDRLRALTADLPGLDYRHGRDPVPMLPLMLHHPRPLIQINSILPMFQMISDHLLPGYLVSVTAYQASLVAASAGTPVQA